MVYPNKYCLDRFENVHKSLFGNRFAPYDSQPSFQYLEVYLFCHLILPRLSGHVVEKKNTTFTRKTRF